MIVYICAYCNNVLAEAIPDDGKPLYVLPRSFRGEICPNCGKELKGQRDGPLTIE